jgi:3-deoxy-D-manno-octulosonate 8-phosphate phosphatase (KDO 8-P phosphatase)
MIDSVLVEKLRGVRLVAFDFDGVFTDNSVYVLEDGREAVRCSRADGLGLDRLRKLGIELAIISTETNQVVQARARKLRLRCVNACEDKRSAIISLAAELSVDLSNVAFVGNDINDLPALTVVGVPIVVGNAHPDVLPAAIHKTRTPGGHGAVRELCDLIHALRTTPSNSQSGIPS